MKLVVRFAVALSLGTLSSAALGEVTRFNFAAAGQTYTGLVFPGDPRIDGDVDSARIQLGVEVNPGADAADFMTDLLLPLLPDDGATNVVNLSGADLGWSGSGLFHYSVVTDDFNGTILQTLFGAETGFSDGRVLENSFVELTYTPIPEPASLLLLTGLAMNLLRRR